MAQTLMSLILLSVVLTIATPTASTRTGFSLELIHRFHGNFTKSELAQKLLQQSQSHISYIKQSIIKSNTTTIRPPVEERKGLYLVSLTIGTGQGVQTYYLEMDTGSGLTWTQCQPCNPCFPQSTSIFDPSRSPSYDHLSRNDPLCVPPYQRLSAACGYALFYADRSFIDGILSKETFTFQSSTGQPESFPDLVFGCTHSSNSMNSYNGDPAGILGLDTSPESFMTQLGTQTGNRFSYCLTIFHMEARNYLRFGDDIIMTGPVQRTPFVIYNGLYYLKLHDISINGQHLNIPQGTFELHPDGTGGCIIDSGAGITHMIFAAIDVVKWVLAGYFRRFNLEPIDGSEHGMNFEMCYRLQDNFNSFPSMTLHFEGADLQVEPEQLFAAERVVGFFCLMIASDNEMTVIGAYQQANTRFTYDVVNRQLSFVPEDCAHEA